MNKFIFIGVLFASFSASAQPPALTVEVFRAKNILIGGTTNVFSHDGTNFTFNGRSLDISPGAGFPLTNSVSAGGYGFEDLGYVEFNGATNRLLWDGTNLTFGGDLIAGGGGGSLAGIYAPTNASGSLGLFTNASQLTLETGDNMILSATTTNNGSNVVVRFQATSAIAGPVGATGIGTNLYYLGAYASGKVTASNGPTIAAYGGEVWIATNSSYTIPAATPPGSDPRWSVWIAKGEDGQDGSPSVTLSFITVTNGQCVTTNEMFSYGGSLWWPRADLCPFPIPTTGTEYTNYYEVVERGDNAADTNLVFNSLTWAGPWAAINAYPSNSVVSYSSGTRGIYLATNDVSSPGPWPGTAPWVLLFEDGTDGGSGAPGSDGVGNLIYDADFSVIKTYDSNTLVSFVSPYTGKRNLYRSLQITSGNYPHLYPAIWDEIISSGEDATVLEWIWRGTYSSVDVYSDQDLVRYGSKIYYSKYSTDFSGVTPGIYGSGSYWEEFVRDGTSVMTNLIYRGGYSASGVYCSNDVVSYAGSMWAQTNACSTNVVPATNAANWFLLVSKGDTGATGPASTNNVTYYFYSNIVQITYLTNEVYATYVTNTTNVTVFNTYSTNVLIVTNIENIVTTTDGVRRVTGFGITNETPSGLVFETGNSFLHSVDGGFVSTIRLNTNYSTGGGGTGIVSYSAFQIDINGGLMPREDVVSYDEGWYYDDDANLAPR